MAIKFNPFTGNFDLTGSGGGASYIDGEVQNFSALPQTIGTPPVDSAYLVREAEGAWLLARKPAGIYIRTADTGVRADDWTHAGAFPDVFNDANFLLYDNGDSTKNLQFQLSGIDTATTRTLTIPNASGRIQVEGQPIGNTTPAAGTFTTLAANNGTLTASAPVLNLAQTWNNAAVAFTGLRFNATNTASNASSLSLDLQTGGSSVFTVRRDGTTGSALFAIGTGWLGNTLYNQGIMLTSGSEVAWANNSTSVYNTLDVRLARDAADALAQRRLANPQAFRIYNTTDAGLTNFERGFMRWSSNVLQIGTEKAGTGSVRNLDFQVDGTSFLSVRSNAVRTAGLTNYVGNTDSVAQIGFGQFSFNAGGANNSGGILFYDGNGGGVSTRFGLDANNVLAIKSGTAAQGFRIYNTTIWERANFRWASNEFIIDAEAGGTGTLRGIKLGSASTSLLGFFGATPVVQGAAVADATDAASTQARLNDLLARLRTLGLIAT